MPLPLSQLVKDIVPERTILFLGAGSSLPSGAPAVSEIIESLSDIFEIESRNFSLTELSAIIEKRFSRANLIDEIRKMFLKVKPTGGIVNLPLYNWKSIYTTNYDHLIEECYSIQKRDIRVYTSDFDFTISTNEQSVKLFKLHGSLETDVSNGHKTRIILTDYDYDEKNSYREQLYNRLKSDLAGSKLIIIGHSLGDTHIREIITKISSMNRELENKGQIHLLMYSKDDYRAELYESKDIKVTFSGVDEFFAELSKSGNKEFVSPAVSGDILAQSTILQPVTINVENALKIGSPNAKSIYNGWPATYADIISGLTFSRTIVSSICNELEGDSLFVTLLGASGVGKTTAARQVLVNLSQKNILCLEHKVDNVLNVRAWLSLEEKLRENNRVGLLYLDDAHTHLYELNELVEGLSKLEKANLKILMTSSKGLWNPRVKSPEIYQNGKIFELSKLDNTEIENLLNLIDTNTSLKDLTSSIFAGFSRQDRIKRLRDRCEADMFVCLRNIFSSQAFDDIVLREFAEIERASADVYKYVAAMESSGVRVHRQLLIRVLALSPTSIGAILENLSDIISEYSIDEKEGIYGWKTRHNIIANIIAKFKFSDTDKKIELFEKIILSIFPTYDIEIRTLRELCTNDYGLPSINNKVIENRLLRLIISKAPSERLPRHRLIGNLLEKGLFEEAETEIRVFEKDVSKKDGPIHRYKIKLTLLRAINTPGLLDEDRIVLLNQAAAEVRSGVSRYPNYLKMYDTFIDVGMEIFKKTGTPDIYDEAVSAIKHADDKNADPDASKEFNRILSRADRRMRAY